MSKFCLKGELGNRLWGSSGVKILNSHVGAAAASLFRLSVVGVGCLPFLMLPGQDILVLLFKIKLNDGSSVFI